MKIFRIFYKSIVNACKSIVRNFSLSLASITCTVITLILVSLGVLISYNVKHITKSIEKELTIVVFMDKTVNEEVLTNTESLIKKLDNVDEVIFNSKDKIKEEFSNSSDFGLILDTLKDEENPFQDSYVIKVKDVKDINETVTAIKNFEMIDEVKYSESTIGEIIDIFDAVEKGTIIMVIALVLVTAFLINNTIKITIFSRKGEIDIMRLVGTSNTVIKLPFLIEGFIIGFLGSIIPVLVTIFGYTYLYNAINDIGNLSGLLSVVSLASPSIIVYKTSLFIVIIGSVIGMLSSVKAVRKYLTV